METKEKTEIVQVKKNEEEMEIDLFELMLYYKLLPPIMYLYM